MEAYKLETTIGQDRAVNLQNLPFRAGTEVEVILIELSQAAPDSQRYPLRGSVIKYEDPFAPVAVEDWDALK